VLTIENFASFSRHVAEADPQRVGVTIYVGGYPSLATQEALKELAAALPADVPFFHWSDIDPDGTWIFRAIESSLGRELRPHLMSADIAESFGKLPPSESD
jgi:DNA topoisomerase VI subunit A